MYARTADPVATLRGQRLSALAAAMATACIALPAFADEAPPSTGVEFRSGGFPGSQQIDLSRFNKGNVVLPGSYRGDVRVNDRLVGSEMLVFQADAAGDGQLCMDRAMVERLGVELAKVPGAATPASTVDGAASAAATDTVACRPLDAWVPGATARFDTGEQVLAVQVPQLYMSNRPLDFVPREQLDSGVTSAQLQYNANVYDARFAGVETRQAYVGVRAGINAGGWRLRHNGSLAWDNIGGSRYQASSTYAQRDIDALQSQLVVGQMYTQGDLFGSVRLLGAQIATDDRMLPDSLTGYAPIVRGVAETNALVRVLQRGAVLRELTVAPGPFQIDDLNAVGFGGDLEVLIQESDGRERRIIVPFSGNTRLLRPGYTRFAVSAGRADPLEARYRPFIAQAQIQRGLSNTVTGFGGVLKSQDYAAAQIGAAVNTPIGALSVDLTHASLDLARERMRGQSVQFRYIKQLPSLGTNFALGAYRYSTEGFVDVNQALRLKADEREGGLGQGIDRFRSRLEVSLSQSLGRSGGSVYVVASRQDFWNRPGSTLSYSAGYNTTLGRVGIGLLAQRTLQLSTGTTDDLYSFTLNVPLGEKPRAPRLRSTLSQDAAGRFGANVGLNGSAGEDGQFTYGVTASEGRGDSSVSANARYQASQATVGGTVGRSKDYRNVSLNANGAVVAHAGGITLAPNLGDTVAIIHAPGAKGARITGGSGARVDRRGYAVHTSLNPYRFNTVEIDQRGLSQDVLLKTTAKVASPRDGAVVALEFPTETGRALLVRARRADGQGLPFAAAVYNANGDTVGNVGQGSRLQVLTDETEGVLTVRWGSEPDQQCQVDYQLPPRVDSRQRAPDVIDQATCYRAPWVVGGQPAPQRVSAVPARARPSSATAQDAVLQRALP